MKRIVVAAALAAAVSLGAAACGAKRNTAATQPSPAAFDATKSDPKALALVDASVAALGGFDKWNAVRELHFEIKYQSGGKLAGWQKHTWDRWDGRHHFMMADPASLVDPTKLHWLDVKYDLFDKTKLPYAAVDGQLLGDDDARRNAENAKGQLANAYMVMIMYKLRDPGVQLATGDDVDTVPNADDLCKPKCNTVKVSFDPAVGTDAWQIELNSESHLPQVIEKVVAQGAIAFRIDGWTDAGGLKWPAKLTNLGLATEYFEVGNVTAGDVHASEYEVPVDRRGGASAGMGEGATGSQM